MSCPLQEAEKRHPGRENDKSKGREVLKGRGASLTVPAGESHLWRKLPQREQFSNTRTRNLRVVECGRGCGHTRECTEKTALGTGLEAVARAWGGVGCQAGWRQLDPGGLGACAWGPTHIEVVGSGALRSSISTG